MQDISELEEIVAEKYQAKLGGKKGNLTLYSFDGKYKVVRSFADRIVFNEAAKSAEALFKECVGDRVAKKMQVEYVFQDLHNLPEGYIVPEGRENPGGQDMRCFPACRL